MSKIKYFLRSIEYITDPIEYNKRVVEFHQSLVVTDTPILSDEERKKKAKETRADWEKDNVYITQSYQKQWRADNPDYQNLWRQRNKDKVKQYNLDYRNKSKN
jgi:hypothetical protein